MKKILAFILILSLIFVSGCFSSENDYYQKVQGYVIKSPNSTVIYYALSYDKTDNGILLKEWWTYNGGMVFCPTRHTGELNISGTYSIESVVISSLPKK